MYNNILSDKIHDAQGGIGMNKLKDMKIKQRLKNSFLMAVIVSSIAGILALVLLFVLDAQYSSALVNNGFIQGDIGEYNSYLNKSGAFARDVIMLTDEAEVASSKQSLEASDEMVVYYLEHFTEKLENKEERALLDIINTDYPKYVALRDEAFELSAQGKKDEALEKFRKEAVPYLVTVMQASDDILALNVEMGDSKSDSLTLISRIMMIIIVVVIGVAFAVSRIFTNQIAHEISEPIEKMEMAIKKMAHGELDVKVDVQSKDEMGEMAKHFNKAVAMINMYIKEISRGLGEMSTGNFDISTDVHFEGDFTELAVALETILNSLSSSMKQINDGSEQVALGAQQLAENAQQLAEGATSQAGAVEELTATVEGVTITAKDSAVKTENAYKEAEEFAKVAEQSSKEMEQLTEAMQQINNTSKEIESIIAEIEDIASQTNLLSLNASIEAARAGEAGKGFSVVADQIGKLASDSAQSAVNTRELISKSMEEINRGNKITASTAEALEKVIGGIRLLADSAKESSNLSAEQAEIMEQIQQGIEQIADVVQSNSASAQETSATSEELFAQSESLKALVSQFKVRDVE